MAQRAAGADDRRPEPRPARASRSAHRTALIVAVIDARRGEVFYAFYRQVPGGVQRLTPTTRSARPTTWPPSCWPRASDVLLVGDGALRVRATVRRTSAGRARRAALAHPSASPLVQLAHAQALREEFVNPWDLEPLYLRKPDAEINWATRDGR